MPAWSPASLERKGAAMHKKEHKAQGTYACPCSAETSSLPVIIAIPNMRHLAARWNAYTEKRGNRGLIKRILYITQAQRPQAARNRLT
ncbi:uncharacterized protein BO87DRAFT_447049 [Aspergillus neoniger CBS 115656]|uniref:Uncharacterized protein n=1 Tax=Aspergillus neoniger (strain CBS 115656) TaxID=1448310 RepID=A0A318Y8D8_ASPNB|nr:hypothetical protein BO87DRAFT_447049 [Aspergillus neoniger CBS 115656]PYH29817.1 hypothetical protein BO87DRAFT_447049 [Aspergillus neoniger CBS 115656]